MPDIELAFVPPNKEVKKDDPKFLREEDLEGHMLPEGEEGIKPVEKNQENEENRRVKMLLEKDNQVRHALELLKTWTIFSKIKTGPAE